MDLRFSAAAALLSDNPYISATGKISGTQEKPRSHSAALPSPGFGRTVPSF
jgi:hypothetical protein